MQQCIQDCLNCYSICATAADFMLRGSPMHQRVCAVCADACRSCEEDCRRMAGGDQLMLQCADACHRCAESCERMAAATR